MSWAGFKLLLRTVPWQAWALLALLACFGGLKAKAWWYEHKAHRLEHKLEVSKAETKVARQNEAQTQRSAVIATATTRAQDEHTSATREATARGVEVIHDQVRKAPAADAPPADDPVVRAEVDAALARARAAADRVQRAPGS